MFAKSNTPHNTKYKFVYGSKLTTYLKYEYQIQSQTFGKHKYTTCVL